MESILNELGIKKPGSYSKSNSYVIDLDNSEEFGKVYSTLDSNDSLEYIEDSSLLTTHNSSLSYNYGDNVIITLIADFDNDSYKLVAQEV